MVNTKRPGLTGPGGRLKWLQVGCPPPGDPRVAPGGMQCHAREGKRRFERAGLSPARSLCTGQNAETRSNGAPLGRPMLLFLTRTLNMPGAAGFSAQG